MFSIVILAAGLSTRFERNKLLEPINGQPLIRGVVSAASSSKADEVIIVLGYEAKKVRSVLKGLRCRLTVNREFGKGQSSSIKVGVRAASRQAKALLILPGDVALITSEAIDKVIYEYSRTGGLIVVASHKGIAGHPILFDRSLFPEVLRVREKSKGLKAVVYRHRNQVRLAEVGSDVVLYDFDTADDFRRRLPSWRDEPGRGQAKG